jgi:hypothetical protein
MKRRAPDKADPEVIAELQRLRTVIGFYLKEITGAAS